MTGEGPCLVPWEKERLERSLSTEIEFYEGRLNSAIGNPTDPRRPNWERKLDAAKKHLEEVKGQPVCAEEVVADSTTPVAPLPSLPPSQ